MTPSNPHVSQQKLKKKGKSSCCSMSSKVWPFFSCTSHSSSLPAQPNVHALYLITFHARRNKTASQRTRKRWSEGVIRTANTTSIHHKDKNNSDTVLGLLGFWRLLCRAAVALCTAVVPSKWLGMQKSVLFVSMCFLWTEHWFVCNAALQSLNLYYLFHCGIFKSFASAMDCRDLLQS